jgi:ATP/ADP translocase
MAAAALIGAVLVIAVTQRQYAARQGGGSSVVPVKLRALQALVRDRYFRLLLIVGACAALAGVLVEFQFYLAATEQEHTAQGNIALFANVYLALSIAALVVQVTVTGWLQQRAGLGGTLLILPATLALLSPAAIVSASLMLRTTIRLAEGGLKASIHRISWEQAYLPLAPEPHRGAAKLVVDGAVSRMTEGAAALLLFAWLRSRPEAAVEGRSP